MGESKVEEPDIEEYVDTSIEDINFLLGRLVALDAYNKTSAHGGEVENGAFVLLLRKASRNPSRYLTQHYIQRLQHRKAAARRKRSTKFFNLAEDVLSRIKTHEDVPNKPLTIGQRAEFFFAAEKQRQYCSKYVLWLKTRPKKTQTVDVKEGNTNE